LRVLILLSVVIGFSGCSSIRQKCSDGWRITGYYTPIESDFSAQKRKSLVIENAQYQFAEGFIAAVRMEGWGRTRYGWYLGYYSGAWHRSSSALNAHGQPLSLGVAAMKGGKRSAEALQIDGLNSVLGRDRFIVQDTGSGLKSKQVDIYTGEGEAARAKTFAVTRNDATVCRVM
jgi:hypothetical protein